MKLLQLLILLLAVGAYAADTPTVQVRVSPESVTVGESIQLQVTVLGPSWFPQPPRYPSFEVTNAVVRLPPDSSYPTSQRVGSDTWSGVIRNYEVIPLIGGNFQLDDLVMQVTYADPETIKPIVVNVDVPPVAFSAVVPAGAENLDPYIAGTDLQLHRELDGETGSLQAGDALVVHYTAELDGLPSIFIPDFVQSNPVPGVSVYRAEPGFTDNGTATRSEQLTFVFEAGGGYEIPAVSLDWWNTATSTVETTSLPAITVDVTGPPVPPPPTAEAQRDFRPLPIAAALLLVLAAGWALRRIRQTTRKRRAERKRRYLASEAFAFEQLQQALASGDAHESYGRLLEWLGRLNKTDDAARFARENGDETLQREVAELRAALYSGTQSQPDLPALARSLTKARKAWKRSERHAAAKLLPSLNP